MPEGPEIKRAADAVAAAIEGRRLTRVELAYPPLAEYEEQWPGLRVEQVRSRGKALLIRLSNREILYSHNQLYGRWFIRQPGNYPKTNRQLRVALETDHKVALLYSATEIEVLRPDHLSEHTYLASLGPDILDPGFGPQPLRRRLLAPPFRRRQLAALYLDQGFLAGPGNYLRSEILFLARLHPGTRPEQLNSGQRARLAELTIKVAEHAYQTKGRTTADSLMEKLKAAGHQRRDWRFYVYGRGGEACHRCASQVAVKKMAGRDLFFCPRCQAG